MIPMPKGQPLLHVQDLRVAYPGRATRGVTTRGVRSCLLLLQNPPYRRRRQRILAASRMPLIDLTDQP